jgi:hypothetical protein
LFSTNYLSKTGQCKLCASVCLQWRRGCSKSGKIRSRVEPATTDYEKQKSASRCVETRKTGEKTQLIAPRAGVSMVRSSWCGNKLETEVAAFRNLNFKLTVLAPLSQKERSRPWPESEDRQSHAGTFTRRTTLGASTALCSPKVRCAHQKLRVINHFTESCGCPCAPTHDEDKVQGPALEKSE